MIILGIETSHGFGSVAIVCDGQVLALCQDDTVNKQAENLFGLADDAMNMAGCGYKDIDYIATNIGPGSFTGVRVGVAAARGLGLALKVPVLGVNSFEALALPHVNKQKNIFACLDARRGQVYWQQFLASGKPVSEGQITQWDEVLPQQGGVAVGETDVLCKHCGEWPEVQYIGGKPNASHIAQAIFLKKAASLGYQTLPSPLYIRDPDAKKSV